MIRGKFISDEKDHKIAYEIQASVLGDKFIEEKRNLGFQHSMTVLVYNDEDSAVATGELVLVNLNEVEVKNVAVRENYQKKGYGDVTVRMLVNKAMIQGFDNIYVKVDESCKKFFEKIGFVSISNDNKTDNYTLIDMKYGLKELKKPCSSAN